MNDQLIFNNYLLLLKSTVEVYVHGTLESSNDDVRDLLKEMLDNTMSMQKNVYLLMVDNGWYQFKNVDNKNIEKVLKTVNLSN